MSFLPKKLTLALFMGCLGLALACGGGGGGSTSTLPAPAVSISVTPGTATLLTGATQQFTATVANSSNTSVTWTVQEGASAGSIDSTGLFTAAPAVNGASVTVHVVATAVADTSKSATATMTLNARTYQGTWSTAASPVVQRLYGHALTLLKDGRVLMTGGLIATPYSIVDSCEIFDPTTNTWAETGKMSVPRRDHTATLLPNGKVLVAGGSPITGGNGFMTSAEIFDPATGSWVATGSMSTKRETGSAHLLPSGKVLVVAGYASDAEVYDPAAGAWSAAGSLGQPYLTGNQTMALSDGRVVVAGGTTSTTVLANAKLYNPATNTMTDIAPMSETRTFLQGVALLNGKVLVCGGSYLNGSTYVPRATAEVFDPATGAWTATGSMISFHSFAHGALLSNGRLLVFGGSDNAGNKSEIFDPATGTWNATGTTGGSRMWGRAIRLKDGKVLVVGGNPSNPYAEIYQ